MTTNQVDKEQETQPVESQEEKKPLFSGTDSQGKERLFTDVEEVQQSWQSAQNFIRDKVTENKTLEARVQELEAQLNQSTKLEDALKQLKGTKEESPVSEQQAPQTTESTPQSEVEALKAEIAALKEGAVTKEYLTSKEQQALAAENQKQSIAAAQAIYGEAYEDKLRESAKELGMTDEEIIQEAQKNPVRFKKLFGLDKQQPKHYSPNSSANVSAMPKKESSLKWGGFSERDKLSNHLANMQAIAEKRGIKLN